MKTIPNLLVLILITCLLLFSATAVMAQGPGGPPGPPGGTSGPVDGGAFVLLLTAVFYGYRQLQAEKPVAEAGV
jgi:hypothetical protein